MSGTATHDQQQGFNVMITGFKVRSHTEPGSHGCGFTHYESMAHCFTHGVPANVVFCHVPPNDDQKALEKARNAILAIIGACCVAVKKDQHRDSSLPEVWRKRFEDQP